MGTHRVATGESTRSVSVTGATRAQWRHLLNHHDQDDDAFAVALIAVCCGLGDDDAWEVWDETPPAVSDVLLRDCLDQSKPRDLDWAIDRLAADWRLAEELRACQVHGVSHDEFLAWSEDAQDLAVASVIKSRDHCPGCGVPSDAMEDPQAARVEAVPCVHCQALAARRDSLPPEVRDHIHLMVVPRRTA